MYQICFFIFHRARGFIFALLIIGCSVANAQKIIYSFSGFGGASLSPMGGGAEIKFDNRHFTLSVVVPLDEVPMPEGQATGLATISIDGLGITQFDEPWDIFYGGYFADHQSISLRSREKDSVRFSARYFLSNWDFRSDISSSVNGELTLEFRTLSTALGQLSFCNCEPLYSGIVKTPDFVATLAMPVPQPHTYSLLLLGLGFIAVTTSGKARYFFRFHR